MVCVGESGQAAISILNSTFRLLRLTWCALMGPSETNQDEGEQGMEEIVTGRGWLKIGEKLVKLEFEKRQQITRAMIRRRADLAVSSLMCTAHVYFSI